MLNSYVPIKTKKSQFKDGRQIKDSLINKDPFKNIMIGQDVK